MTDAERQADQARFVSAVLAATTFGKIEWHRRCDDPWICRGSAKDVDGDLILTAHSKAGLVLAYKLNSDESISVRGSTAVLWGGLNELHQRVRALVEENEHDDIDYVVRELE